MKMKMISIDLGKEGAFALWENGSCHKIQSWSFLPNRFLWEDFKEVIDSLENLVMDLKKGHLTIVVEKPSRNMTIQWALYTDVRRVAKVNKLDFVEYMPTMIKKIVTGNGKASKDEIRKAVCDSGLCKSELSNEHEADAVAAGICLLWKIGIPSTI